MRGRMHAFSPQGLFRQIQYAAPIRSYGPVAFESKRQEPDQRKPVEAGTYLAHSLQNRLKDKEKSRSFTAVTGVRIPAGAPSYR